MNNTYLGNLDLLDVRSLDFPMCFLIVKAKEVSLEGYIIGFKDK